MCLSGFFSLSGLIGSNTAPHGSNGSSNFCIWIKVVRFCVHGIRRAFLIPNHMQDSCTAYPQRSSNDKQSGGLHL